MKTQVTQAQCVCVMYGFHNMSNIEKFRSGNLLENGNKNQ